VTDATLEELDDVELTALEDELALGELELLDTLDAEEDELDKEFADSELDDDELLGPGDPLLQPATMALEARHVIAKTFFHHLAAIVNSTT